MTALVGEHYLRPIIWDWCVACRLYLSHTNGYVACGPHARHMIMVCRQCERETIIA